MLRVIQAEDGGRRLFIGGLRCHHGLTGCVVVALGIAMIWHDRHDWRVWLVLREGPR